MVSKEEVRQQLYAVGDMLDKEVKIELWSGSQKVESRKRGYTEKRET